MGRNVANVEAEIKELERELALPGKPIQDADDFEEVNILLWKDSDQTDEFLLATERMSQFVDRNWKLD